MQFSRSLRRTFAHFPIEHTAVRFAHVQLTRYPPLAVLGLPVGGRLLLDTTRGMDTGNDWETPRSAAGGDGVQQVNSSKLTPSCHCSAQGTLGSLQLVCDEQPTFEPKCLEPKRLRRFIDICKDS